MQCFNIVCGLCSACGSSIQVAHMPAMPAQLVTTSGAGDCLVAGCCWGLLKGQDIVTALAHGMVSLAALPCCRTSSKIAVCPADTSSLKLGAARMAAQCCIRISTGRCRRHLRVHCPGREMSKKWCFSCV